MSQVLLVDDDSSVLFTLAIALRRRGHTVTVAQSAAQALNLLHGHDYGFLVSDVRMPGMTGIELAHAVQELDHPPRVVLTSAVEVDLREMAAEVFMTKPVDVARLSAFLGEGPSLEGATAPTHPAAAFHDPATSFRSHSAR